MEERYLKELYRQMGFWMEYMIEHQDPKHIQAYLDGKELYRRERHNPMAHMQQRKLARA